MKIATLFLCVALVACSKPSAPASPSASATSAAASAAPAPVDRWRRAIPAEPDPRAKALYRRALDLVIQGRLAEARPLLDQIRRDHPDSRFALRLSAPGGRSGGPLALLAGLATLLAVGSQE